MSDTKEKVDDSADDGSGFRYFVATAEEFSTILQQEGGLDTATATEPSAHANEEEAGVPGVVNILEKYRNEAGERFLNGYKYVRKLNQGDFASIKLYESSGKLYAVKALNKVRLSRMKTYKSVPGGDRMRMTTALEKAREELDVLMTLPCHAGLIELVEVIEDGSHHKIYMVFPFLEGGRLLSYSQGKRIYLNDALNDVFLMDKAKVYIAQVSEALAVLHKRGIMHLDVKPENLLLDAAKERCILADFGSAKVLDGAIRVSGEIRGTQGTLAFLSPEACIEDVYNGYAADAWALAVTFHVSVYGVHPFDAVGQAKLLDNIATSDYTPPTTEQLEKLPTKTALSNLENEKLSEAFKSLFQKEKKYDDSFLRQLSAVLSEL